LRKLGTIVSLIATLLGMVVSYSQPVQADTCRVVEGHQICIQQIKRSAKYPWEYRASVRIDGQSRPLLERYDCRRHQRTRHDGTIVPFTPAGAGELICKLVDRAQ